MENEQKKVVVGDLKPKKFELETNENTYILELDNSAVKKADEIGLVNKMGKNEMGIQEVLQNLLYVFLLKNKKDITLSLSKKIASTIIDEKQYGVTDLVSMLLEELTLRYQQVFILDGTAKRKLKVI